MKYIVDIDALKDCLDMIDGVNGEDDHYVPIGRVKKFIDLFPKDQLEIPKLMKPNILRQVDDCDDLVINLARKATDAGNN